MSAMEASEQDSIVPDLYQGSLSGDGRGGAWNSAKPPGEASCQEAPDRFLGAP